MKKTLKILLAVVLFAVVLTIAGSVNAATTDLKTLADDATEANIELSPYATKGYVIKGALTSTDDIDVDADTIITFDTAKAAINFANKINVNKGTLTLKVEGTTNKATLTGDITVKSGATLKVMDAAIGVAKIVAENNVTVDVKDTLKTTGKATITTGTAAYDTVAVESGVVFAYASGITVTSPLNSYNTVAFKIEENGVKADYYTRAKGTLSIKVTDTTTDKEVIASDVVKDTAYKMVATYTVDNYEVDVTANVTFDSAYVTKAGTNPCTITVLKKAFDDDEVASLIGVYTVALGGTDKDEYTAKLFQGTITPNPDEDNNNEDNNNPADKDNNNNDNNVNNNEEDNKDENKEDKELDPDTPNTGDHIIPATALLAVVVVANVVYFAKMKRN